MPWPLTFLAFRLLILLFQFRPYFFAIERFCILNREHLKFGDSRGGAESREWIGVS